MNNWQLASYFAPPLFSLTKPSTLVSVWCSQHVWQLLVTGVWKVLPKCTAFAKIYQMTFLFDAPSSYAEYRPQQNSVLFVRQDLSKVHTVSWLQRLVDVEKRLRYYVWHVPRPEGSSGRVLRHSTRLPIRQWCVLVRVSAGGVQQQSTYHGDR